MQNDKDKMGPIYYKCIDDIDEIDAHFYVMKIALLLAEDRIKKTHKSTEYMMKTFVKRIEEG